MKYRLNVTRMTSSRTANLHLYATCSRNTSTLSNRGVIHVAHFSRPYRNSLIGTPEKKKQKTTVTSPEQWFSIFLIQEYCTRAEYDEFKNLFI